MYLQVNRWIYDPDRGIPMDCQNPQKARPLDGKLKGKGKGKGKGALRAIENEDDQPDVEEPPPAGKRKVAAVKNKTPSKAPVWTLQLESKLTAAVQKWTGQASNGGIAWVQIQAEMGMTKHYVTSHWKKIGNAKKPLTIKTGTRVKQFIINITLI